MRSRYVLFAIMLGLCTGAHAQAQPKALAQPLAQAQFQQGMAAARRGDNAEAFRLWLPLAEKGHSNAQNNLGVLYERGRGVPRDDATAVAWYRRAADQGNGAAQNNLGVMYEKGLGVARDP